MTKGEIAWQSKDIASKFMTGKLKNKSLEVYGIKLPRIVDVLPTELPDIMANELRVDNLFRLEDGTYALIDYESVYRDENKIKYLDYIVRILRRYKTILGLDIEIRMIVIYTADVEKKRTKNQMNIGCLHFWIEEAFLSELNSDTIWLKLKKRVEQKEQLTEEEMMEFIILPLTYEGSGPKRKAIKECFDLAKEIEDPEVQVFILSGMLVFSDKVISDADANEIREWIRMTKVGRLIAAEMDEARREGERKALVETEQKIAVRMLRKGQHIEEIAEVMEVLSAEDIEKIAVKEGLLSTV